MTLTLVIGRRSSPKVADFAEASAVYRAACEASGEGASTFPEGAIFDGDDKLARVSYNGRVWFLDRDKPNGGGRLVYCPSSAGKDEGKPDIFNQGRESVWGRKVPNPYSPGTVEHEVFERGAEYARGSYAK